MKIIDSHVHFWHPDHLTYGWLDDVKGLKRPFLPTHYAQATAGIDVPGVVFVQADCLPEQALAEVDWAAGLAAPVQAIVGFAPLALGAAARPYLVEMKKRPLVKGIRQLIQSEAAEFASQPKFVEGVQLLSELDFRFDICITYTQLTAVIKLVEQCPKVQFVLDHIGKPDIAAAEIDSWRKHIRTLASFPTVYCKLSGVITEAHWAQWTEADIRPYVEHAIDSFTIDRVMFGSDWPVINLAGPFSKWFETLNSMVSDLSEADKQKLFYKNCRQFYGMDSDD